MGFQSDKKYSIYSMLIGCCASFLCLVFIFIISVKNLQEQLEIKANKIIAKVDDVSKERELVLTLLNASDDKICNDSILLNMRRALFDARYIKDIGFFEGNYLVCTTGAGYLKEPLLDFDPDFKLSDGTSVRYVQHLKLQLFDSKYIQAVLVRKKNYNVVLAANIFDESAISGEDWELVYIKDKSYFHLAGNIGVYNTIKQGQITELEHFMTCSDSIKNYCTAIIMPWEKYISENKIFILFSVVLITLIGIIVSLGLNYYFMSKRKVEYRTVNGIKNNNFIFQYQPIVELNSGNIVGCEVLTRFKDHYGWLYPDEFIKTLQDKNITWEFTEYMFRKVIHDFQLFQNIPENFKLSFNIFPSDIETGKITKLIDSIKINELNFKVCLEITENEYLDSNSAHLYLQQLVQAGFIMSIDDFGTGYSNLKNLSTLDFHQLKIDRSFVQDIETQGLKASMIPNIMSLVEKFNYTCVAEGIETKAQEDILKTAGVKYGQGWRYAKAMPFEEFKDYINKQS
ncbi:EAL domain-containing protein [Catenovulum sp. 2E275]|uniref:EAL domain-containing protein n=1 Tax=Catenovulum sp. 2E275 TaxID=2980497 RepID=UPI0021D1EDA7|nr:EAL domain-containing protein [Catenovulum sp. 2E275]MCU4674168.1 EAL domain-containing protein [Catenovulum sp. 2E275]